MVKTLISFQFITVENKNPDEKAFSKFWNRRDLNARIAFILMQAW